VGANARLRRVALHAGRSFDLPAATLGLRVFLCVVTVLFSLLVIAYADRMAYEDWRPTPQQWLLWLNTASLTVSSIAFQWASISVRRGRSDDTRVGLVYAGLFAVAFLFGQLWAWRQLNGLIYFERHKPGNRLLLPDHGAARAASAGRLGGLGQHHGRGVAPTGLGPSRTACEIVRDLLALPARALANPLRPFVLRP
jgi:cytochrome c oxidase subunit 3